MSQPTLVIFEGDLRLMDNPALTHAARRGAVIPVWIESFDDRTVRAPGAAARWWLHHALEALRSSLAAFGVPLILRRGSRESVVEALLEESGATAVYANRSADPAVAARQERVAQRVRARGLEARLFGGALLHEPEALRTQTGGSYTVFTPFWKRLSADLVVDDPLPAPALGAARSTIPPVQSMTLDALGLLPRIDWAAGFREEWTPGEAGAHARLEAFIEAGLSEYAEGRNRPDREYTSRISPHLAHGEITPRQLFDRMQRVLVDHPEMERSVQSWLREVGWREFGYHVLHHSPKIATEPLKPQIGAYPWRMDERLFRAWRRGRTGYPIVDAGMRELWHTGWMHNRVRMIVASFLTKDLGIDWRDGEAWFWDTLVDADAANNPMGWQWTAGCGADAQPFFRIFNPTSQGEKFDPDGEYVRRWVPELRDRVGDSVHRIDSAQAALLPSGYPPPIVDHALARERAMQAYRGL